MDETELKELYKLIKRSYDESCWKTLNDALEYISEFVEVDEELPTDNDWNFAINTTVYISIC